MDKLTFIQGEDFQFQITVFDDQDQVMSLIGFSFQAMIKNPLGYVVAVALIESVDVVNGIVTFKIPRSESISLFGLHVIQVKIVGSIDNTVYAVNQPILVLSNGDLSFRSAVGSIGIPAPIMVGSIV